MSFREHRLRIMKYSAKNLWLLIFPLLRGISVLKVDLSGIYQWLRGAWLDIAVICVIVFYGFIQWRFSEIKVTDSAICRKRGVIFRTETVIPFESVSSAAAEQLFFLVPFKAVSIRLDTGGGFFKSADMKLLVSSETAKSVMSRLPDIKKEAALKNIPKPGIASVLLFSVFFSGGFSGAVYIAAFFFKGGEIAKEITTTAFERVAKQAEVMIVNGIPKAAAIAAVFFMSAWLLSFIVNLMMYALFDVSADRDFINVSFGLLRHRKHRIRTAHINYIDLRQNLIMKICGAFTVNISCPGYGYDSHLPVIVPISSEKDGNAFSVDEKGGNKFRPVRTSFFSYAGLPFFGIILTALFYNFSDRLLWDDRGLWKFLAVMAYIPLVWRVMVKSAALFTSGITVYDDKIIVRSVTGTIFHTVTAKRENVALVQIKRNISQRIFRKCTVVLWFTGETSSRYRVKGMRLNEGVKIAEMLKYNFCRF